MNIKELTVAIRQWAYARNIIKGATSLSQFAKLISEYGECGDNLHANNDPFVEEGLPLDEMYGRVADDIGDQFVVLTIIAEQEGFHLEELLDSDTIPMTEVSFGEFLLLSRVYGRIGDAILKRDIYLLKEQLSLATLLLGAMAIEYADRDLEACVQVAYDEIKDRRGLMYNGTFIKSTDDRYSAICEELGLPQ